MELKTKINKPYTEKQRLNFIVEANKLDYEIRETEIAIEAWGYTEEEKERQEQDRVDRLTMTALDLITAVKLFGVTDKQVEDFLNANLDIKHQLQFCQNVYCGVVKSFCPITIGEVEITAEVVEQLFKNKNDNQQV